MLCEASLNQNESRLAAQTFAAYLQYVTRPDDIDRLLERFCALCTVEQARPVFAALQCSSHVFHCLTVNTYNRNWFDHAEALAMQWRMRWPNESGANVSRVLGWIHWRQLKYAESLDAFDRSIALSANSESLRGRAFVLSFMGRFEESVESFRELEKLEPGRSSRVRANSLFGAGYVRESMACYEQRLAEADFVERKPPNLPEWNGGPLDGRLLVLLDIGWSYGDFLMYLRYLALLQPLVASVRVQVPAPLEKVLKASFPSFEIRSDEPRDTEGCDAYVWLMSLPVKLRLWSTASETLPWLRADQDTTRKWADWLPAHAGASNARRRRIGVCWRGNPFTYHDRFRSSSLDDFAPLFETLMHVDWVNIQLGASECPPEHVLATRDSRWCDPMPGVSDFADTVAIARGLDMLITIDSAVAHLCASAGVPTTLLVPIWGEWRWQTGDTSSWYPNVKLLRTPPGSSFRQTLFSLAENDHADA